MFVLNRCAPHVLQSAVIRKSGFINNNCPGPWKFPKIWYRRIRITAPAFLSISLLESYYNAQFTRFQIHQLCPLSFKMLYHVLNLEVDVLKTTIWSQQLKAPHACEVDGSRPTEVVCTFSGVSRSTPIYRGADPAIPGSPTNNTLDYV